MKKEPLVLDFDGTVAITDHIWIEYFNRKYEINSKKEDYDPHLSLLENVKSMTGQNLLFDDFFYDFTENYIMSKKLHNNAILLPGADIVISELSRKYSIYISTMRNSLGRDVVKHVLQNNNILQHFKGFHFVYSFDEKKEFVKVPKVNFINSFMHKAAYFVDDSHHEINAAKEIVPCIWLNDGSSKKNISGIWTAVNWYEIGDFIL